ncbi:MAG: hypothetical protein ABFS19_06165 [Thermodesulfobacteriota bacterium]
MANAISELAHINPHALRQHNNKHLQQAENGLPSEGTTAGNIYNDANFDQVTIDYKVEASVTYSSSLTVDRTADTAYALLRGLVVDTLREQGIEFQIQTGDKEIDISQLSPEKAQELIAEEGYFGVEQTSERIVDFAIGLAGNDRGRLDVIREGVEKGFNDALEAFGGWLPDISYETYDAVMAKLDDWASGAEAASEAA